MATYRKQIRIHYPSCAEMYETMEGAFQSWCKFPSMVKWVILKSACERYIEMEHEIFYHLLHESRVSPSRKERAYELYCNESNFYLKKYEKLRQQKEERDEKEEAKRVRLQEQLRAAQQAREARDAYEAYQRRSQEIKQEIWRQRCKIFESLMDDE